ncbi:MAG: hypothetical protein WC827_02005 [Candidatus Paceibacterota bacterium]|jgi:hypothetical protein
MAGIKIQTKALKWTPDLAYIVGLLTTDGCLSPDKRHIIMTSSDIEQLENFKKCLKIKNKIGITKNYKGIISHRVQFGDIVFYKWLVSIGLMSNKSKILGEIKIPDKFFIDFLRGHLDGDGSITTYLDKYNTRKNIKYIYKRLFVRFISVSRPHIEWLSNKIYENTKILGRIHTTKSKIDNRSDLYTIKFMKKKSLELLPKIYYSKKLPTLSRKREIYENFTKNN